MFQINFGYFSLSVVSIVAQTFAKQNAGIQPRIILGQDAFRAQFPFYVYLEVASKVLTFDITKICGASLISDEWTLTAGHCVSKVSGSDKVWLFLGPLRLNDKYEIGRKIIAVSGDSVYMHPKYSSFFDVMNPTNDIALIKLPSPVQFNDYIKPVPLACTSTEGMHAIAMGNGVASIRGTSSALKYVELQINQQNDETICSNKFQFKTIAPGDSGGPLVSADNGALIGITSNGGLFRQCFTRVEAYLDWIKDTAGILTCVQMEEERLEENIVPIDYNEVGLW